MMTPIDEEQIGPGDIDWLVKMDGENELENRS